MSISRFDPICFCTDIQSIWEEKWTVLWHNLVGLILRTSYHHKVGCRYNIVQCNMIFHAILQLLKQYINQSLFAQKTPHILPVSARYIVNIFEKTKRIITSPTCNMKIPCNHMLKTHHDIPTLIIFINVLYIPNHNPYCQLCISRC